MDKNDDKIVKWVQLTDLHFLNSTDQNLQEDYLKDLEGISFLVITGDLKQFHEDYNRSIEFISNVKTGLRLKDGCLFFVPGNHDINGFPEREQMLEDITKNLWNNKDCYLPYKEALTEAYSGFLEMSKTISYKDFYIKKDLLFCLKEWDGKLNILHINSSLVSGKDSHKEQIVDIYGISKLKIENDFPTIIIMHHDFYSLYGSHQDVLKRLMLKHNVKACLSGHKHQISKRHIDLPNGTVIPNFVSGKSISQPNDFGSDNCIIVYEWNLDSNTVLVKPFEWSKNRFQPSFDFNTDEETKKGVHGFFISLGKGLKSGETKTEGFSTSEPAEVVVDRALIIYKQVKNLMDNQDMFMSGEWVEEAETIWQENFNEGIGRCLLLFYCEKAIGGMVNAHRKAQEIYHKLEQIPNRDINTQKMLDSTKKLFLSNKS